MIVQPTFTRASIAFKQDGSQVASGVPRFEAGRQVGPVEPTVNILPVGAAACTDLAEMRADSGTTKTVDTVGQWTGTGCFKLGTTGEALGGYLSDAGYPILPATRYSASAVVKGAGNLTITFKTYPSNGTVTTTIELTDKFQRVECPNLLTGASDTIVRFIFRYTSGTGTFWIDAAQIEQKDHCTPWTESRRVSDQAIMIEEGTPNMVPNPDTLSSGGIWTAGNAASLTDLGCGIVNGVARIYYSNNDTIGAAYRFRTATTQNITIDKSLEYSATFEVKPVLGGGTISFYAYGTVTDDVTQKTLFTINIGTKAVTVVNGCTLLEATLLSDGFHRVAVKIPTTFWTGSGVTLYFFTQGSYTTIDTFDYYVRKPQLEQKAYNTSFAVGTRNSEDLEVPTDGLFNIPGKINLFKYSQEFDNASWVSARSTITPNATNAPDGTATADKLVADTQVELAHHRYQSVAVTAGTTYTFSVFAKAGEYQYMALQFLSAGGAYAGSLAYFDLQAGTYTNTSCDAAGIVDVGDGWYHCWARETAIATLPGNHTIMLCQNYADSTFTGDGTSGIFIWGAQLGPRAYLTAYNVTTAAPVINPDVGTPGGAVECWAKAPRRADMQYQALFAVWPFFYIQMLINTDKISLLSQNASGVSNPTVTSTLTIDTAQWHHYVVTWDAVQVWLYVDGVLFCTTGTATFQPMPATLQLGARSSATYFWNGLIDDLRLYQTTLTGEQVAARFAGAEI